jgi:hypothetical protein
MTSGRPQARGIAAKLGKGAAESLDTERSDPG